jgi:DNA repair protein RecO (recombination protein O)
MIVKTEAIVLRTRKFRETSRILSLYTREFGKLSAIAKGARGSKNKFGASLQSGTHVSAVLYKNDQRDLHLLSQCDTLTDFRTLSTDLEKFTTAMSVLEMAEVVSHDEERNVPLFELLLGSLHAIAQADRSALNLQYYFEIQLADILGFRPNFHTCLDCGTPLADGEGGTKGSELRLGNGGVLCDACSERVRGAGSISPGAIRILQHLQESQKPEDATRITFTPHQTEEVSSVLRQYLESHVGGLHRLKAWSVARNIV